MTKLLVHPDFRRRGIARALMIALEDHAGQRGRSLITLDTAGASAQALYRTLGYLTVGDIPDYAMDASGRRLEATTIMYKRI